MHRKQNRETLRMSRRKTKYLPCTGVMNLTVVGSNCKLGGSTINKAFVSILNAYIMFICS